MSSILPENLHIPLTSSFLTVLFLMLFLVAIIHMVILHYHWRNFGNNKLAVMRMSITYFVGSAILFGGMIYFLTTYTSSVSHL